MSQKSSTANVLFLCKGSTYDKTYTASGSKIPDCRVDANDLENCACFVPAKSSYLFRKIVGAKNVVLPDGQPPTVAYAMLAQPCGLVANETD